MSSLLKIDDNNFVIKMKTAWISCEYKEYDTYKHLGYSWKLKRDMYPSVAAIYLNCAGPVNKFWSIDASITINVKKSKETVAVTKSFNTHFNKYNPETGVTVGALVQFDALENIGSDVEVYVKINSITGIENKTHVEFEEEDAQLSDVALVVEGKKLYVNKAVLATFSPVFRAMFFSGFKESTDKEVIISDVKYEDFKKFLQAIHSRHTELNQENVQSLLILADRYDAEVVMEKCEIYLLSSDKLDILEKLNIAETYKLTEVYKKCMDSIDTKEKLLSLCKFKGQFSPMTSQAVIKKFMDFK